MSRVICSGFAPPGTVCAGPTDGTQSRGTIEGTTAGERRAYLREKNLERAVTSAGHETAMTAAVSGRSVPSASAVTKAAEGVRREERTPWCFLF